VKTLWIILTLFCFVCSGFSEKLGVPGIERPNAPAQAGKISLAGISRVETPAGETTEPNAEDPFSPYQIIIDKHPFGEEPPGENEAKEVPIQQSFAKNFRLSMLYEGSNGIRVGFVDGSQNDKSYILSVGETVGGIELVEADIAADEAILKKGNEIVLFKLKEDPTVVPTKKRKSRTSTYAERRKAQQKKAEEERKAREEEHPPLTGEELRQHLEAVQMDAIRTGKPPLPMKLTPEMDRQLVSEGVLDPL